MSLVPLKDGDEVQFGVSKSDEEPPEFLYKFHTKLKVKRPRPKSLDEVDSAAKRQKLSIADETKQGPSNQRIPDWAPYREYKEKVKQQEAEMARKMKEYEEKLAEMQNALKEKEEKQAEIKNELEEEKRKREEKAKEMEDALKKKQVEMEEEIKRKEVYKWGVIGNSKKSFDISVSISLCQIYSATCHNHEF